MLSLVSAREPFSLFAEEPLELVDISSLAGMNQDEAKNFYALRIKDASFLPFAKQGDVMVARRHSSEMIQSGDKVVHKRDGAAECCIKFVEFSGDYAIIKPMVGGQGEVVPIAEICHMDKIMYVACFPLK